MENSKKGLISLILGIFSVASGITGFGGILGLIAGIVAMVLSKGALEMNALDKKAKLGKIFGLIGIIISIVGFVTAIIVLVLNGVIRS
ncbi:MAG: hypothetical protein IKO32_00655 [Lachnospiraceae bacterium]|nr:hypothetical protein [Selenomonadaceae bacterium]MBR4579727.1 hypothetical protein [Lachnospiraceae bacterium]